MEKTGTTAAKYSAHENGRIEYHYGFYGAVHVEYEPRNIQMEYLQEHELGDEPVRMDMLILKHDQTPLTDPVGSFFRGHNVLEYKSPEDHLSINDFYKVQGYAMLYKGLSRTMNEVPAQELTVSIFQHAYPREMFRRLEEIELGITMFYPGVYHVTGRIGVPTQVIVTSRLPQNEYEAFKALSKDATREDLIRLLKLTQENEDPKMIDYVRAVLNVSIAINKRLFTEIKEAGIMTEAVYSVFKEEMDKERQEGRQEGRLEGKQEGRQEGILETLHGLVKDGILTLADAAKRADLTPSEFLARTSRMK